MTAASPPPNLRRTATRRAQSVSFSPRGNCIKFLQGAFGRLANDEALGQIVGKAAQGGPRSRDVPLAAKLDRHHAGSLRRGGVGNAGQKAAVETPRIDVRIERREVAQRAERRCGDDRPGLLRRVFKRLTQKSSFGRRRIISSLSLQRLGIKPDVSSHGSRLALGS